MQCMSDIFSNADSAELAFRIELLTALVKVLQKERLDYAALAEHAGIQERDLQRICEGDADGMSTDTLIRVLGAAGYLGRLTIVRQD